MWQLTPLKLYCTSGKKRRCITRALRHTEHFSKDTQNKFKSKKSNTAQKVKFSIMDFFSKRDQIRRKLRIWSHLLKKSLMKNFFFCSVMNAFMRSLDYFDLVLSNRFLFTEIPSYNLRTFGVDRFYDLKYSGCIILANVPLQ